MVEKIDHTIPLLADKIYAVFQVSYKVEAKLLNAVDFPPLRRKSIDITNSSTEFYGAFSDSEIAGVIEIKREERDIHIQSLVVDPTFFRKGIGSGLLTFVVDNLLAKVYTVETGVDNLPAIALYKKFGFIEIQQWNTDHGVRKVKFLREMS